VLGVFKSTKWMPATKENFPALEASLPGRWGFEGEEAEGVIAQCYFRKRVPDQYRKKGAANPVRFIPP